jgi:hypothetical protein
MKLILNICLLFTLAIKETNCIKLHAKARDSDIMEDLLGDEDDNTSIEIYEDT